MNDQQPTDKLCKCGHTEEEHSEGDSYYSKIREDEVWSNDICSVCGCWHFNGIGDRRET